MFENDPALILNMQSTLTDAGREKLGGKEALLLAEQLMSVTSGTITITQAAIRVEANDAEKKQLMCYEVDDASGQWRNGRLIDHTSRSVYSIKLPAQKAAIRSWLMPTENREFLQIYLQNGLLLKASEPSNVEIHLLEMKYFWGDLFWLQPNDGEPGYWDQLMKFGLPQQVTLLDPQTGAVLVETTIISARRGVMKALNLKDYRVPDKSSLHGSESTDFHPAGGGTYALGAGSGEHIGWIISPNIIKEVQTLVNEVVNSCGEFSKLDSKGGLIIDWYDRASQSLGVNNLNAFTRLREVLKSVVAMHILPGTVNDGEIPPEMILIYGQWLTDIFADKKVPASQRWCAFLNGLKKQPPEFGGKQPTEADHIAHRQEVLLELVNKVIQERYASPVIDRLQPYHYSCWAFDFDAYGFKMKLKPGNAIIKSLDVTSQGLRLDIAIEKVRVDFEYETEPSGSAGNVALCIGTFGLANIVEIQFGSANVIAKDILLSLDLIPTQDGNQIYLKAKLGGNSHMDLSYYFSGSNIFTLGMTEVLSAIFTLADAFEGTLMESIAEGLEDFINDLDLRFPEVFNFEDAPVPILDTAILVSNPGEAQIIGATLKLPAERAPTPMPSLAMPICKSDFAMTLATDYLNGVMAYRMDRYKKTAKALQFDWKTHLSGTSLPDVTLPSGYKPPEEGGKYPSDFEENHEEWTVGMPVFKPNKLVSQPNKIDPIGEIAIPITYRLVRTHYAWGGIVRKPLMAPEWWWQGLKGPMGPGPVSKKDLLIDLDDIMTIQYGMYRQADGRIISKAPPFVALEDISRINPSPGWHAVDVGGIIVEWYPNAVATDEHINVQLEATMPAHINLTDAISFLPGVDLTYGALQVSMNKASYSTSFPGLQNQPDLFPQIVEAYLKPFATLHPFKQTFQHAYANVWLLCEYSYLAFGPKETILGIIATIDTMMSLTDSTRLQIEGDSTRLKISFNFLEQIAG